jgi:uncharacterized PurR-regulated membrane protein YhhQ (DUF165 family)
MTNEKNNAFKYYPILLTIVIAIQLMCFILVKWQINIHGLTTTASGLLFPLDIYLFEIIGYSYGYEYARQAVWVNGVSHLFFFLIIQFFGILPFASTMNPDYVIAYQTLFKYSYWIIIGSFIGNFCGDYFSAFLVPKSKVFFNTRFNKTFIFIIHIVSEFITISISYTIINLPDNYQITQIAKLICSTMIFKTIIALIMLPFAKQLINFIRNAESVDIYDQNQNYKLFKFNPDFTKIKMVNFKGVYNVKKNFDN